MNFLLVIQIETTSFSAQFNHCIIFFVCCSNALGIFQSIDVYINMYIHIMAKYTIQDAHLGEGGGTAFTDKIQFYPRNKLQYVSSTRFHKVKLYMYSFCN